MIIGKVSSPKTESWVWSIRLTQWINDKQWIGFNKAQQLPLWVISHHSSARFELINRTIFQIFSSSTFQGYLNLCKLRRSLHSFDFATLAWDLDFFWACLTSTYHSKSTIHFSQDPSAREQEHSSTIFSARNLHFLCQSRIITYLCPERMSPNVWMERQICSPQILCWVFSEADSGSRKSIFSVSRLRDSARVWKTKFPHVFNWNDHYFFLFSPPFSFDHSYPEKSWEKDIDQNEDSSISRRNEIHIYVMTIVGTFSPSSSTF